MSKTKVYDMKVLTDEQVEFETKEFTETIQRINEIVENMSHEKLVYINRIDENNDVSTWCLCHTDGLREEVLSLCHIDEDFPLNGDKMSMCHILFTLLSPDYGLDDSYFEIEE